MRKIILLLLLFGCSNVQDNRQINISVSANISFEETPSWVLRTQSGWQHTYDSVELIVTNNVSGIQTIFTGKSNVFNVLLTAGNYNIYLGANDDPPTDVTKFLYFFASTQNVEVKTATPIILTADSKQALLLVTKSAVQSVPKITIAGRAYDMFSNETPYYYAYIKSNSNGVAINVSLNLGGTVLTRDLILKSKNRYVVSNPTKTDISATDPVLNVIQI